MTHHTRINVLVVVVLITGAIWGALLYLHPSAPSTQVSATVVSASEADKTVTLLVKGTEYVVPIASDTVIAKEFVQDLGKATISKEEEINIGDLTPGLAVAVSTVSPFMRGDQLFPQVKSISIIEDSNETEVLSKTDIFTSANITKVDLKKQFIEYGVTFPNAPKSLTFSVGTAGIPVYSIDDPLRAQIIHARTPASLSDLKVGDAIVIHFRTTATLPQTVEIVLINK